MTQKTETSNVEREEEALLRATLRLNGNLLGVLLGLLQGVGLFVATNFLVLKGGPLDADGDPLVGPHLSLLGQYFIGYEVTFLGSFIGFGYAFVLGWIMGQVIGRVYNWVVTLTDAEKA